MNFNEVISDADLIITGEGKIDGQSVRGKVPVGVADRADESNVPVIAVVGDVGDEIEAIYKRGALRPFSVLIGWPLIVEESIILRAPNSRLTFSTLN